MNWVLFAVLTWIFLGLEAGLRDALSVGSTGIAPSFVFSLLTLVAMSAPRQTVLWAAVGLGLCMDLVFELPLKQGIGAVTILGPHALAYALACQLIVSMRGLMIRRNPLTMGFLAMIGAAVSNTTLVAMFSIRVLFGTPLAWEARHQLFTGLGSAVYTGLLGVVLAFVLFPAAGPLGLPNAQARRFGARR